MTLAVVCALAAALSFAFSSAMHQRATKQQRRHEPLDPRLLLRLLHSRLWRVGWVPDAAGSLLQALALRFGPLAIVQPLLASGLFMAIPIEAVLNGQRIQRRDLAATAIGATGLAVFLLIANVGRGVPEPSPAAWRGVAIGAGTVVVAAVLVSRLMAEAGRGTLLGIATGVNYGVTAALLKAVAARYHGDLFAVVFDWRFLALVLVGFAGLLLSQNAFQSGRLAAPLTALTLTDPVTSIAIGLTAFQETLSLTGWRSPVLVLAVAAIAVGIWLAATARPVTPRDRRP